MLSIKGMLGPEDPMGPRRSPSGEQQPPLPRSSPESQALRECGQGRGDLQGLGVLSLAATRVGYATSPEDSQLPPPPLSLTAATNMVSSQTFPQHGTKVNTFFNLPHRSNRQPAMINDFPKKIEHPRRTPLAKANGFQPSAYAHADSKKTEARTYAHAHAHADSNKTEASTAPTIHKGAGRLHLVLSG